MHKRLWYTRPASDWLEGLPVGTGRLAGMVWGGMKSERLTLNHEWLWRGMYRDRDTRQVSHRLDEVRQLLLAGKYEEGTELGQRLFGGSQDVRDAIRIDSYQPAGDLWIDLDHDVIYNYKRELDLERACVSTRYDIMPPCSAKSVRREVVASLDDDVIFVRIVANKIGSDEPSSVTARLRFDRAIDPQCKLQHSVEGDLLRMKGQLETGIEFELQAKVWISGDQARMEDDGQSMMVYDASEILVAVDIGTSVEKDPVQECRVRDMAPPVWDDVLSKQKESYAKCMGDFLLDLPLDEPDLPTDVRVEKMRDGQVDPGLILLFFNYGRYLLAASSANGQLPANLQGKWNEDINPAWKCDLHLNINLQMNYWPAEPTGMGDCVEALLKYLEHCIPHGKKAASDLYGCRGIYIPHCSDPWGRCSPEAYGWGAWVGGAAWLAQHMWWRYEFSQDLDFLRNRAYPFMKLVAEFFEDYLIEDESGQLAVVPSQSPENLFVEAGNAPYVSLCVNAAMDVELVWDVLTHLVRACDVLDVDRDCQSKWTSMLEKLPALGIGRKGQLLEWNKEFTEVQPGHRHLSHLYGLYPGEQFCPRRTPELYKAAEKSLELRMAASGGHTGWSRAWVACCFARLGRGEDAFNHLSRLIYDFATTTMLDLHPPRIFQIDGNLGGVAAVAEMLLQSYHGELHFLPALPAAWPAGSVKGLRARGGYTVNIDWADGKLKSASFTPIADGPCRIVAPNNVYKVLDSFGQPVQTTQEDGVLTFNAEAGKTYCYQSV